jgi:multidrug efflux pump subunit AcrA (membrane-fusion protein)
MLTHLLHLLKWGAALAVLAGLLTLAWRIQEYTRGQQKAEAEANAPPQKSPTNKIVKLGARLAESHGIEDEPARAASWAKWAAAYGRVVPNPRAAAEVRVAFAGTLRAGSNPGWPVLGTPVQAGQVLGWLDIRVGPQERLDLTRQLAEARLKATGAEEQVRVYQQRYDRLQGAGAGVSRSELDSARTQLTEARTQADTANAAVKAWQQALEAIDGQGDRKGKTWSQPLTAPSAGEVTELLGRPGMTVEPGGLLARLVDFRFALVRLEIPPEALTGGPPEEVDLFTTAPVPPALNGGSNRPDPASPTPTVKGRLVGTAPQVEVNSQFAAYWYEVDTREARGQGGWRPGLFVKGLVKVPGAAARDAVSVPETSLLYHDGRALVYVRLGDKPGRYERREVQVLGREPGRWVLASGVQAGEPVVSRRAQVVLSEEFRSDVDND